ncbi:hypothetical protein [Alienimonas californiensis]|uniref:Uncharacterized protein n=1 Tax=Alienimonas californiensis TaxID=2527989 RepID=A0A517PBP2_9PLAN|nr:hypothetical protein [Alienimonas californiensis]QDT16797.1 hypothetical protein CA12_29040 [Alienimonas californiensis]
MKLVAESEHSTTTGKRAWLLVCWLVLPWLVSFLLLVGLIGFTPGPYLGAAGSIPRQQPGLVADVINVWEPSPPTAPVTQFYLMVGWDMHVLTHANATRQDWQWRAGGLSAGRGSSSLSRSVWAACRIWWLLPLPALASAAGLWRWTRRQGSPSPPV